MYCPKPICGPEFQVPAPLNANERRLSMPACLLHAPLREMMPLKLVVACANVYGGCNTTACWDAVIQPYWFDPELDPEGEAPEEVQTLRLQPDI